MAFWRIPARATRAGGAKLARVCRVRAEEGRGSDELRDVDHAFADTVSDAGRVPEPVSGPVVRQERLGEILSHYYREAA